MGRRAFALGRGSPFVGGSIVLLLVAGGVFAAGPVGAQEPDEELRAAAERVASGWSGSEVARLGDLLLPRGIGVHVPGAGREMLDPRKAIAALEELLGRLRTTDVHVVRVHRTAGAGDRGSAELRWEARAPGTSEVLRHTVFVGFTLDDDRWRVYEIRVLP